MITTFDDFIGNIKIQEISYEEFCSKLSILDISDKTGQFSVRSDLLTFLNRVVKKPTDTRLIRLELYQKNLYNMLVVDARNSLQAWFTKYVEMKMDINDYLALPEGNCIDKGIFIGNKNSKYGRLNKNINFNDFYNTKKLYNNDSEYVFGLLKTMYENFHIRNSLAGPAFFDHICTMTSYNQIWTDFMMGANKASVFNPYTYKSILDIVFKGDTLFAPVMGWNSYQQAFYSSRFKHFISTDVISNVYNNGLKLHNQYQSNLSFLDDEKTVDLYLCPSEQLDSKFDFIKKYENKVDAVLFSPPYFDLELYTGENQSVTNFPKYEDWLDGYWRETIKLCKSVMKPNAKFGFVISNYRNHDKIDNTISQDMKAIVDEELKFVKHYQIQWNTISSSRQAHKHRKGNYEDLWIFEK